MPTSQTPQTHDFLNDEAISVGGIAYYNQRLRNQIFEQVLRAFAEEAEAGRINKASLARKLGKEPSQITRWFSGPSNWTLDTVSTLLLGMDAELDTAATFFRDRAQPNYAHPLVEQIEGQVRSTGVARPPEYWSLDDLPTNPGSSSTNAPKTIALRDE